MSLPKSWLELRIGGVAAQLLEQEVGLEDVDAHGGERHVRLVGHAGRVLRLLQEGDDAVLGVDVHDAEAGRLHARHLEAADGDVGAGVDVLLEHALVVHLVDVVAGQHDDVVRAIAVDDVDVLIDRIGGAGVPLVLRRALAGGQDIEALVALGLRKAQPRCRWRIRLWALYWVATAMRRMPELSALDSAKSMMRVLPPKKTAGLARLSVSSISRLPRPPAST